MYVTLSQQYWWFLCFEMAYAVYFTSKVEKIEANSNNDFNVINFAMY